MRAGIPPSMAKALLAGYQNDRKLGKLGYESLIQWVFLLGPLVYACIASLKGSELWAPMLKVVHDGVITVLHGFRLRGPCKGTIGSTSDVKLSGEA